MVCALFGLASISLAVEDMWRAKEDMLTARGYLSTNSTVNGKIYAIGGWEGESDGEEQVIWANFLSTVEEYDPVADRWAKKANMPTPRCVFATGVVNGKIYIIGGWKAWMGNFLSTVEEYDPVADRWKKKASMLTARISLSASVVDGKIYAIGGLSALGEPPVSTVEVYDPVKDKWAKKTNMPTARYGVSTSVVNGKIYAIGGGPNEQVTFATVEEYDPVADEWAKKTNMPTARHYLSTSAVNGKIYAIGGRKGIAEGRAYLSTVEEYDPVMDKWTEKADLPTARVGLCTSVVNGKIYAIGGRSPVAGRISSLSTVEEYGAGFAIEAKGKLATSWGKIKSDQSM